MENKRILVIVVIFVDVTPNNFFEFDKFSFPVFASVAVEQKKR